MAERDFDVMTTDIHRIVDRQHPRLFVAHPGHTLSPLLHHTIPVVLVRTAVVRCDFTVSQQRDHHVLRFGDVLRTLEDVEVLVLNLLALSRFSCCP